MVQYYQLTLDVNIPGAWYLAEIIDGNGDEILASEFISAKIFKSASNISVVPNVAGKPVDFRVTAFGVPIVSKGFADTVEMYASDDIQRIPVSVGTVPSGYEILNLLVKIECLDHKQTQVFRYTDEASAPPGKLGQIYSLGEIKIKPELTTGKHIFWLAEWPVVIIISESLKSALEEEEFIGARFIPA